MANYNQFFCSTNDLVSGSDPNCDVQIGAPEKLIFTPLDFSFATIALAQDIANWNTAIAAEEVFPLPLVEEYTNDSEDDTYYTSNVTSLQAFVREGKQAMTYMIKFNPSLHARLRSGMNGKAMRLITVDATNKVVGTSPDGVIFQGWKSGTLRVEKWRPSDGSNLSFTVIKFVAESTEETDDNVSVFQGDAGLKALNGIIPASLSVVGTPTATEIVVGIATADGGTPIEGITEETDFLVYKADGVTTEAVTGVAESATIPAQYTLTGAAFETLGTVNLNGVVSLANENYSGTAVVVTF